MKPFFMSNLGQFLPIDRLSGRPRNLAAKRRDETELSPPPPPPKRRRRDDVLSPGTGPASAATAAAAASSSSSSRLVPPLQQPNHWLSDESSDLQVLPAPSDRIRHPRQPSVVSSSLGGGSRDFERSIIQPELRQVEEITTPPRARRRRRRRSLQHSSVAARFSRPSRLVSPGVDDGDDQSPVREVAPPPRGHAAAGTRVNTNSVIVLPDGPPSSTAKPRFRSRMAGYMPSTNDRSPQWLQNGAAKRTLYAAARGDNDSVDELSKDFYSGQQPPKKMAKSTATAPGIALSPARALPASIEHIVEAPLHVKAAFRQPAHCVAPDPSSPDGPECRMTIRAQSADVLVPLGNALARREDALWLRVDLRKVHTFLYNIDSPVVLLMFPQEGALGASMGLQFRAVEEARRMYAWANESAVSRNFKFEDKPSTFLERRFNKNLREAQAQKEAHATRSASNHAGRADDDGDKAVVDLSRSEPPPSRLGRRAQDGFSSPERSVARSSPGNERGLGVFTRTRAGRHSRGPTETVDLDGDADADLQNSSTPATPATPATSSSTPADSRLERLRNRSTRTAAAAAAARFVEPPSPERWTQTHPDWADDWRVPLTYARTTVDKDDVARLDDGEFLNDNIINFYLQFLQDSLKNSDSSLAKRVYFHNTFFYEKLRPSRGNVISFEGVKRWTAKVDLFSYDYIVVPVNEHAHWWVAIICNVPKILEAALPPPPDQQETEAEAEAEKEKEKGGGPDAEAEAEVEADATAEAKAESAEPIDVDEPSSIVVEADDDRDKDDVELLSVTGTAAGAAATMSSPHAFPASPLRFCGRDKLSPIHVDDHGAKPDPGSAKAATIVLDSVEKDGPDDQGEGTNGTPRAKLAPAPAPASTTTPTPTPRRVPRDSKSGGDSHASAGSDADEDVTEIKSDVVSAKKPGFRSRAVGRKVFIPAGKKPNPKDPRIFTLDSLGSVHTASVDHLKQWLLAEIAERKGVKPVNPGRLGTTARAIPQQENFCDCGVYLLLYIQEFIKDPDSFIEDIVLRHERPWDTSAPDMRRQLRALILHMQKEYQAAREAERRPKKKAAAATEKRANTAGMEGVSSPAAATPPVAQKGTADGGEAGGEARSVRGGMGSTGNGDSIPPVLLTDAPTTAPEPVDSPSGEREPAGASSAESSVGPAEPGISSPFRDKSPNAFEQMQA